jgi:hypothetical protein
MPEWPPRESKPSWWRAIWEQYGCTRCGAPPGQPCRTDRGNIRYEPHADRSTLASKDGWRPPEPDS